jgi:hypothetical protein
MEEENDAEEQKFGISLNRLENPDFGPRPNGFPHGANVL